MIVIYTDTARLTTVDVVKHDNGELEVLTSGDGLPRLRAMFMPGEDAAAIAAARWLIDHTREPQPDVDLQVVPDVTCYGCGASGATIDPVYGAWCRRCSTKSLKAAR